MTGELHVHVEHLSMRRSNHNGQITILDDITLSVGRREFVTILGPSGCGKSTFLRCVAGFEPFEGTVTVDGECVEKPSPSRVMVFQGFDQLFPWKTVSQNLQYALRLNGHKRREAKVLAEEYILRVGLGGYEDYYPHQLSGGMKQRAAIARTLALKPALILMDEPFASLDAITRDKIEQELVKLYEHSELCVLFVTHNVQEALCLGTRLLVMDQQGRFILDEQNELQRPVSPGTSGYGELWQRVNGALQCACGEEDA